MDITVDQFKAAVSVPMTDAAETFEKCQECLASTEREARFMLQAGDSTWSESISDHIRSAVCMEALNRTLPKIDLIQTPTGFGVVNNNTLSPASKERIERLRTELHEGWFAELAFAQAELLEVEDYVTTTRRISFLDAPFVFQAWTRQSWAAYWNESVKRAAATLRLRTIIGSQQLDYLLARSVGSQLNSLSDIEKKAVMHCREWERHRLAADTEEATALECLLTYLQEYIDSFPLYAESSYYRTRKEKYENKKDSGTFFL